MGSLSRFRMAFLASLFLYLLGYLALATAFPKYPENIDLSVYSTVLLQREDPTLFPRDASYGDGAVTETYWSSGLVYMRLFQVLHTLTQRDISRTIALLHLIPSLVSIVTFYWFLRVFQKDRWLTLMLAYGLCTFLIARFSDGVPTLYYFACIPVFLRLLWQYVIEPGLAQRLASLWRIGAIGALIGSSPLLINSVNGLGFSTLSLALVTGMLLARRLSWQAYAAFIVGLVPLLALVALGGTGGANAAQNLESARRILEDGFIVTALYKGTFFEAIVEELVGIPYTAVFYFPLAIALTALSVWLYRHPQASRKVKVLLLTLSWLFWSSVIGNIGLILYVYFLSQVILRRDTLLDYVFLCGINIAVLNGPILVWLTLGVWQVTQWHTIMFILSQMFRFKYLTFFMAIPPLLFMFDTLTARLPSPWRRVIQILLTVLLMIQNYDVLNLFLPLFAFFLLVVALIEFSVLNKRGGFFTRQRTPVSKILFGMRSFKISLSSLIVILMLLTATQPYWTFNTPLALETILYPYKTAPVHSPQAMQDYLDMTAWIRLNTPTTSLIHMTNTRDNGFFRYLTQRSLLYNWMDYLLGATNAIQSARVAQIRIDTTKTYALLPTTAAVRYEADYIVVRYDFAPPLPAFDQEQWYWPQPVYSNPTYSIYHIESLSTAQLIARWIQALRVGS